VIDLIQEIGNRFPDEQYLYWSRIQGTLWTAADVVIVFYLLRITNLFRTYLDRRRHRLSYGVLALTLAPAAFLPFLTDSGVFLRIELLVTVPHFLIILYLLFGDARITLDALARRADAQHDQS